MNRNLNMLILLVPIIVIGCNNKSKIKQQQLQDTIEKIRIKSDYKPLNSDEAYRFMNEYYLPGLDSTPTGRRIFILQLARTDFKKEFNDFKKRVTAEFYSDSSYLKSHEVNFGPVGAVFTERHAWDSSRLLSNVLVNDTTMINLIKNNFRDRKALNLWKKNAGTGYMMVSYPQYNPHTKRLLIKEWLENGDWCGTNRDRALSFTKISGGWKANGH